LAFITANLVICAALFSLWPTIINVTAATNSVDAK